MTSQKPDLNTIRVLVVDDLKTIQENVKFLLNIEPDIEVVGTANDGYSAIEQVRKLKPDVVLMDLEMPRLDGMKATELICQRFNNIKVIILTINDGDDLIHKSLDVGAQDYLLKNNISAETIQDAVRSVYKTNTKLVSEDVNAINSVVTSNNTNAKPENKRAQNTSTNLESDILAERIYPVVSNRNQKINLHRRCLPAFYGFLLAILGGILYLVFTKPMYVVTASLMLNKRAESDAKLGEKQILTGSEAENTLAIQAELINSELFIDSVIAEMYDSATKSPNNQYNVVEIRQKLTTKIISDTNTLQLKYKHKNPVMATKTLNTIVKTAVEKNKSTIRSTSSSVRNFLATEVEEQRKKVLKAEAAQQEYRKNNGIVLDHNQTIDLNSINNLKQQEQTLQAQIREKKSQVQDLQQIVNVNKSQNAYLVGRIGQDEELKKLRASLAAREAELAIARTKLTDRHPTVVSLLEERDAILAIYNRKLTNILGGEGTIPPSDIAVDPLSQQIVSQLVIARTEVSALEDKLKTVRSEREKVEQSLAKLQPLNELVRQGEEAKKSLELLMGKLEEARLAEAGLGSNMEIIELAKAPSSPNSPNRLLVMGLATAAGVILGLSVALLLEVMDNTLHHGLEVEEKLKLPMLSVLPDLPDYALSLERSHPFLEDLGLYEPYRSLLKTLEFCSPKPLKVVVLSSSVAAEGKSVVASHLGAVSAMLSRKTLIIDANLRRPKQHSIFHVPSEPGLTDVLKNYIDLTEAIQPTNIKNLFLLSCGLLSPHPCKMLESDFLESLLKQARDIYDLVIIDTPPVSSSADVCTLSQYSDGLIMITRPHVTPRDVLTSVASQMQYNSAPVIGFVMNGMDARAEKHYRYAYHDRIQASKTFLLGSGDRS